MKRSYRVVGRGKDWKTAGAKSVYYIETEGATSQECFVAIWEQCCHVDTVEILYRDVYTPCDWDTHEAVGALHEGLVGEYVRLNPNGSIALHYRVHKELFAILGMYYSLEYLSYANIWMGSSEPSPRAFVENKCFRLRV